MPSASTSCISGSSPETCDESVGRDEVVELMVQEMRVEAEGVLSLALADPSGADLPAWDPGAHIDLDLDGILRQYSLCGSPSDRKHFRVGVLHAEPSRGGSAYVHKELRPGQIIEVEGPRNHFELTDAEQYLFIAGGIGITPILAMVEAVERAGRTWSLVYGGRSVSTMAFRDRLAAYGDKVTLVPADEQGILDLDALLGTPSDTEVYACGPEPMLAAVEERCQAWPAGRLHLERFAAKDIDRSNDGAFEVVLQSSGTSVIVPADTSICDALETIDVWLPTACREGICGTCETRVIDGEVEHRDSILTPEERAASKTMMPCVSRCTSARLVLDL
jgi:ferredoxin-NADP reductase